MLADMTPKRNGTRVLKHDSRAKIVLCLRNGGPLAKAEIARLTGLGLTCVCDTCKELLAEGVIGEAGVVAGARGRPTVLLKINPSAAPVAGVRIAPECVQISVTTHTLEVLAQTTISCETAGHDAQTVIDAIVSGIRRCVRLIGEDVESLAGVGVSVHGLVDPVLGIIAEKTNVTGWEEVPIVRILEERLNIPVVADNCVRAAGIVHQWYGTNVQEGTTLYVCIGEGCGAALLHNREIVRGIHHSGVLLGHMVIDPSGPVCTCGKRGCLESLASELGFIRGLWPEITKKPSEMTPGEREELVRRGVELLKSGEARAREAYRSVVEYLGIGLSNAVALFAPRTIVLSGLLLDLFPSMVNDVRRAVVQSVIERQKGIEIRAVKDYDKFLQRGAAGLVLCQPFRALREDSASQTGWSVLGSAVGGAFGVRVS